MARDQVLGRTEELGVIRDFLASIPGEATTLVIRGEPGIGKTTLWTEARAIAHERPGATILTARAVEAEAALAYVTLTDLLGTFVDHRPPDLPAPQLEALAAAMLREATAEPPDPRTIGTAVLGTLRQASADGPVILLLDDAQWIDVASSAAIAFALRRLGDAPVAAVLTVRSTSGSASPPLVRTLLDDDRVTDLEIGPISLGVLHHLIVERVGAHLTRPQLTRLGDASGGNPLLAIEIARELGRRDRWPLPGEPMPVPSSAAMLLEERIARLPPEDREVLFVTAAMTSPTVDRLAVVVEVAAADLAAALDRARADGLITIDDLSRIRFEHPLMASAALLAIPNPRRREIHARLAAVATDVEDRGRHVALSIDAPSADGAAALDAAAIAARARGATAVAAQWAERAAATTPLDDRSAWAVRITRAARWFADSGEVTRAGELLATAIPDMPPGDARAAAMLGLAQIDSWTAGADVGVRRISAALEEATDPPLRARLLLRKAFEVEHVGIPDAIEAAQSAIAELDGVPLTGAGSDPDLLACALLQLAALRLTAGIAVDDELVAQGMALLSPEPRRTTDGDELPESLRAHVMVWERMADTDRLVAARERQILDRERDIASGRDRAMPIQTGELVMTELWLGAWDDADVHATECLVLASQAGSTPQGLSAALAARGFVDAYRGDLDAADSSARRGLELSDGSGDWLRARHRTILAFAALSRGDAATAAQRLGEVYDEAVASGDREMVLHRSVGDLVEAAVASRDLERARRVATALDASVTSVPRPWVRTMAPRAHALLAAADGDLDGAAAAIARALAEAEALPMPFEVARIELIAGRIARRRKERRRATAHLERARTTFAALGAARWIEIVDAELARTGRRTTETDALTETEDRVARLAASGMTNREVGEAAFLTPKSVEGVLARVYSKLDIRSRAELGAWLAGQAAEPGEE